MCHKTHSLRDGQKLTYSQAVYLAIVNTDFRSFLLLSSFSAYCSSPNSGLPRKLTFYGPSYFDPTTGEVEGICKKILAQAACVRHACLRAPCVAWPLLLPSFRLFFSLSLRLLLLTHFGESPMCENMFPPIFLHN